MRSWSAWSKECLTISLLDLPVFDFVFNQVLHCLHGSNKKRLRSQGKRSKRVSKQLLKEPDNRSSLVLWREYAHLEWLLGNLDEARKVFSTATVMGGAKGLKSPSLCELYLLWAQLEVEDGAGVQAGGITAVTVSPAVCVLTRLAEGTCPSSSSSSQAPSPVSILKARKSYEQALTAGLSALDPNLHNPQACRKGSLYQQLSVICQRRFLCFNPFTANPVHSKLLWQYFLIISVHHGN